MARLRAREQQGRSLRVLVDPIDASVEEAYTYAHLNHCYYRYTKELNEKLKETRQRLEERFDWPHQTRPVTDEELQDACNRISHNAVAQLSLANPWPTREMSGIEVLVEDTFPFNQQQFLPVPTMSKVTSDRSPSIIVRHRFLILWIVGDTMSENIKQIIDSIQVSPNFANPSTTTVTKTINQLQNSSMEGFHKLHVVHTIEEAQKWMKENRESLRRQDTLFKVITTWSLNKEKTAVNAIRAVRADVPRVPVLIYTHKCEEIQSALEFPNVIATDMAFE
ncbi:unnamed protein product, partial [Rotaria sordida]